MPEFDFNIDGVEATPYAAAPSLSFKLRLAQVDDPDDPVVPIHSVVLRCQIRLEPARRRYNPQEQEGLVELFGEPRRWGQTLRPMSWAHATMVVPPFTGTTKVDLQIPCTFDLNVAMTKYFDAVDEGWAPLCFLFSGTIFYAGEDGALQVSQISWEKEADFKLPIEIWKKMIEIYYPNTAWLCLRKDIFDRLARYKIENAAPSWEQAMERLLDQAARQEVLP